MPTEESTELEISSPVPLERELESLETTYRNHHQGKAPLRRDRMYLVLVTIIAFKEIIKLKKDGKIIEATIHERVHATIEMMPSSGQVTPPVSAIKDLTNEAILHAKVLANA